MKVAFRLALIFSVLSPAPLAAEWDLDRLRKEYEANQLNNVIRRCSKAHKAKLNGWSINVVAMKATFETSQGTPHKHFRANVGLVGGLSAGGASYFAMEYDDHRAWEPPYDFTANPVSTGFEVRIGPRALITEENTAYFKANPKKKLTGFARLTIPEGRQEQVNGWFWYDRYMIGEWIDKGLWRYSGEWDRWYDAESRNLWSFISSMVSVSARKVDVVTGYRDWNGNERFVASATLDMTGVGKRIEKMIREAYVEANSSKAVSCDASGLDSFTRKLYR